MSDSEPRDTTNSAVQQDLDEDAGQTAVARVPDALLRKLRAAAPARTDAAPRVASPPEPDEDDSATQLLATTGRTAIPTPGIVFTPASGSRTLPSLHAETRDSPDEDPSDTGITGLGIDVPQEFRRSSSSMLASKEAPTLPPPSNAAPSGPMFEPPGPEMFATPPPPPAAPPASAALQRPAHRDAFVETVAPRKSTRRKWVVVTVVCLLALAGGAAGAYFLVRHLLF